MSQESNISVHTFYRDIAPVNSQGEVVCRHDERARLRTSHTDINPGRDFFTCDKEKDDPDNCGFFAWADNRGICAARESRRRQMRDTITNAQGATPQRLSQAQRARVARSPDIPISPVSPHKRQRSPSPPPVLTPKQRRLNGFTSTPESRTARKAAIAVALKSSQGSEARLKSIADELAAVARERQMAHPGASQLPQTQTPPSLSFHKDVQRSQSQSHSDGVSPAAPPPLSPTPPPTKHNKTPARELELLPSFRSRPHFPLDAQSEAAYSIMDEVRQADREDDIEDDIEEAVCTEDERNLKDKRIQTDPIEDEDLDNASAIDAWSSQASRDAMSSPSSSIPFTLPATRMDVDDDVYFGSSASDPTQSSEPGRVSRSSPARLLPQTPSSRQAGSSRAYASGGNESEVDSGERSMSTLLTPPGSLRRDHQRAEDGGSSSTSRRGQDSSVSNPLLREKQRQGRGLDPSPSPSPSSSNSKGNGRERSQWQMIQDDPENPFHDRAAALRASSRAQTSSGIDADSGTEIRGALPGSLSADLVEQQIASLAGLPEYIRKLEKKERAAQKSAEVKAQKIARLEEEVQRLRNTNRTLEAAVAALEARR